MIETMILMLIFAIILIIDAYVFLKLVSVMNDVKIPRVIDIDQSDLPSVSVCISVRDENQAMTQCLERVVASEYKKLEIIVLDDGSQDNTSALIKAFAHSGVRFVEGKKLPEGWLGKNYAQYLLAKEASGQLVMFMDVDTLLERKTLQRAVQLFHEEGVKMLSIIPMRQSAWRMDLLFTTMRHFWLLMRYQKAHPRATANAWIIDRSFLIDQFQTDSDLALSMKVETAIASKLTAHDSYRLLLSNQWLGLHYQKQWAAQVETSIRILFLQCHKNLKEVASLFLLIIIVLIPYFTIAIYPWSIVLVGVQFLIALYYLHFVWPRYAIVGALVLPITLLQELILLIASTYKYKRGTVTWKGRAISTSKFK